jgi:hypothetical protein
VVAHQQVAHVVRHADDRGAQVAVHLVDEELDQLDDVGPALPQRGHDDADDVQPEEEVLAEPAVRTAPSRSWLVAATIRASARMGSRPPTRVNSHLEDAAPSPEAEGMSAISSRKSVPAAAASNLPTRRSTAPVKAPRSYRTARSRGAPLGMAEQLMATKGPRRSGGSRDGVGDELLAGAGLALDEHGGVGRRDTIRRPPAWPACADRSSCRCFSSPRRRSILVSWRSDSARAMSAPT